jgi:hypothetical protein
VPVGIFVGMGSDIGRPSMIGLGQPPAALSKPFLLKMILMRRPRRQQTLALVRRPVKLDLRLRL